jgi:DNA-binding MarR family transcriptional regulator
MKDHVDRTIEQWDNEKPDMDGSALGVMNRVVRLGKHIEADLRKALAPFGLDVWSFDILAALRRQGEPYDLSPTELRHAAIRTSGTMTHRIDRLEERNLVERFADPDDRRASRVYLTEEGLRLIDDVIEIRFMAAKNLGSRLTDKELNQISRLLRKLLLARPEEVVPSS